MNYLKSLVIFVGGAAIGAGVTYKILKNKFEAQVQEEIDAFIEYKEAALAEEHKINIEAPTKEPLPIIMSRKKKKAENEQIGRDYQEIIDLKGYRKTEPDPAEEEFPPEDNEDPKDPFVISEEEFSEDALNFDKITLTYYDDDETLVDECEEIITNVSDIIGDEALLCFGESCDDPNVVYVRNEKLSIDYEVTRVNNSYQELVLGIQKPAPAKRRRKKDE